MSCSGISSLIISGLRGSQGGEFLQGETIQDCGSGGINRSLQRGIDWLASHFQVGQNFGAGKQWKFYYLCGLERAGRLAGTRFFGQHDWYRIGAEELVHDQQKVTGSWEGALVEKDPVLATSFALLFLAKGRAPVLINKLRYGPANDWNNDPDDVRNLVTVVSRDWKRLLTWQTVDSRNATVLDLLRAPILFFNGHKAPEFSAPNGRICVPMSKQAGRSLPMRAAEAPNLTEDSGSLWRRCSRTRRSSFDLCPAITRSCGAHCCRMRNAIHSGGSTGRQDCGDLLAEGRILLLEPIRASPAPAAVLAAIKVGQKIIDYATGRVLPPDKLSGP